MGLCRYCKKSVQKCSLKRSSKFFCNLKCHLAFNSINVGDCIEFSSGYRKDGYCNVSVNGKQRLAHRIAFELFNGEIQEGKIVCHTCDNRRCINPKHLYAGNHSLNALDRQKRNLNSSQLGESNRASKLKECDVLEIRKYSSLGVCPDELSKKFGISPFYIKDVISGRRWGHLECSKEFVDEEAS